MTDTNRMCFASTATAGRIKDAPAGATNTPRGLTHSSGTSREGLGMKPTRRTVRRSTASPSEVAA